MGTGLPSIQQIGLGAAVAIAVDATIVRLVLVPAAMKLLGPANWWMPRRLARYEPWIRDARESYNRLPRRQRISTAVIPAVPLQRTSTRDE